MNELRTEVNFDTYIRRMAGVNDKNLLMNFVKENSRILDVGCGTGELSLAMPSGCTYVGYDLSDHMVKVAREMHPRVEFTTHLNETEEFDAILMSSLVHEVAAYAGEGVDKNQAVIDFFFQMSNHLTDNGHIFIRDGIRPESENGPQTTHTFELRNPIDAHLFIKKAEIYGRVFNIDLDMSSGTISETLNNLADFLNVYTWGWDALERESQEIVNLYDLNGWLNVGKNAGLNCVDTLIYTQDSYFEHLDKLVNLNGVMWPTKMILVLEKNSEK